MHVKWLTHASSCKVLHVVLQEKLVELYLLEPFTSAPLLHWQTASIEINERAVLFHTEPLSAWVRPVVLSYGLMSFFNVWPVEFVPMATEVGGSVKSLCDAGPWRERPVKENDRRILTDLSQWLQTLGSSRLREEAMKGRKQKAMTRRRVLWLCSNRAISVRAAPSGWEGWGENTRQRVSLKKQW